MMTLFSVKDVGIYKHVHLKSVFKTKTVHKTKTILNSFKRYIYLTFNQKYIYIYISKTKSF
jgi:hypothetical protein